MIVSQAKNITHGDGENTKPLIIMRNILPCIEEDEAFGELTVAEKKKTQLKAIALMQVKIGTELKHFVENTENAKEAWELLENTFIAQSAGRTHRAASAI